MNLCLTKENKRFLGYNQHPFSTALERKAHAEDLGTAVIVSDKL
jgi:hypothetical protein